jgi:hypothetical protein
MAQSDHNKRLQQSILLLISQVDGAWSDWSSWAECSVSCGTGLRSRDRRCENPAPRLDGLTCPGERMESEQCALPACPLSGNLNLTYSRVSPLM